MSNFKSFKQAVQKQFEKMMKTGLWKTDVSKDKMWTAYLNSFPEGTNPMFRERTEHDCQCCKSFIRQCGNIVTIADNKVVSIWDIVLQDDQGYQTVAKAMSDYVKLLPIRDFYISAERNLGTDFNHEEKEGEVRKWEHFSAELVGSYVFLGEDIGSTLSAKRSTKEVFKRGLEEITEEAIETVLELIAQGSLYRGEEHRNAVVNFKIQSIGYKKVPEEYRDNFCWVNAHKQGARIRNSAIGTLLTDLSEDMGLDKAVARFEAKVAPENYQRPTALITKSMIANAQAKVAELGIADALPRRYSTIEDITINNILFADRTAKQAMDVFDEMSQEAPVDTKKLGKVEEVGIETFIKDILPKADAVELMVENKHTNNFMSLISPVNTGAKSILKWGNNFSWAYTGEVADSMRERVAKAGGSVTGVLRFSIQWNDGDNNQNDFDAHCIEPGGRLISFSSMRSPTDGELDVDIVNPGSKVAVENITWPSKPKMKEGEYHFLVHNYSHNGGKTGFTAEIEYDGQIYSYAYNRNIPNNRKVTVAKFNFSRKAGIKFIASLQSTTSSKEVWGVATERFQKVSVIMNSPNHWDGEETGNKHYFFILEDCKNPDKARGFFNEFLNNNLTEHRKVFEILGSKMRVEESESQLSGLGFSSTKRSSVLCKVSGAFTRTIKINF